MGSRLRAWEGVSMILAIRIFAVGISDSGLHFFDFFLVVGGIRHRRRRCEGPTKIFV